MCFYAKEGSSCNVTHRFCQHYQSDIISVRELTLSRFKCPKSLMNAAT